MPRQRFVHPDVVVLPLSDGDTLTVKKRLNHGEQTEMNARMYREGVDGQLRVNPGAVGMAMVLAYLLDWTFTDPSGKRVAIEGKSADDVQAILNSLDPDDFKEVRQAIDRHEAATDAARIEQKKTPNGGVPAAETSSSPSALAGESTGSEPSTSTTTTSS